MQENTEAAAGRESGLGFDSFLASPLAAAAA
jgi:hypothetical protein